MAKVLFVDDEAMVRKAGSQWLRLAGFEVEAHACARDALEQATLEFDGVVVTDVKMPDMDGLTFMRTIHERDREIPVIIVTGHGDIGMAVDAMRDGAYDFIEKPSTNVNVLINGETGSGKGLVARCLHDLSPRREHRFVAINCGAIPGSMFESELFGHEGGAFTGANRRRVGRFEYAQGGTIFLDEIESMPLEAQVKLLQVIEERQVQRLGSNEPIPIDVRFIAATKTNLEIEAEEGRFRADLFYRLNVAELHILPLRRRCEDILLLFDFYATEAARLHGREMPSLTNSDQNALLNHRWPGNVRELKNIAERYVLQIGNRASGIKEMLQPGGATPEDVTGAGLAEQVNSFEKSLLQRSLQRNAGSIAAVVEELNVPRRTLNKKMQKYNLARCDFVDAG